MSLVQYMDGLRHEMTNAPQENNTQMYLISMAMSFIHKIHITI